MPVSRLVIAEKPSVAASLAKVLKASARKDGYFEGNGWIVSWCVGHLVELEPPGITGDMQSLLQQRSSSGS